VFLKASFLGRCRYSNTYFYEIVDNVNVFLILNPRGGLLKSIGLVFTEQKIIKCCKFFIQNALLGILHKI
jgi:hypothetical protein